MISQVRSGEHTVSSLTFSRVLGIVLLLCCNNTAATSDSRVQSTDGLHGLAWMRGSHRIANHTEVLYKSVKQCLLNPA